MDLSSKLSFCLLSLLFDIKAYAQNTPKDFVKAHNAARSKVGVPNIAWDEKVAAYSQKHANKRKNDCKLAHSDGPYGENIAWSSGDMSGTYAVKLWVAEKSNYDYKSNSCVGGQCLHYTQVVWKNSTHLGCARVRCNNGGTFISCNYSPRGNIIGYRPY